MWAIYIRSSFSKALSAKSSKHFQVFSDSGLTEHEDFFFTSLHLDNLGVEDSQTAFFRLKALMRILNGILELNNQPRVAYEQESIMYIDVSKNRWFDYTIYTNAQLEYEELQNPFKIDDSKLQEYTNLQKRINRNSYVVDLFDLAYEEELVKEVLVLFSLIKIDPLYILINTLKIIETIEFDLGLQIEKKKGGKNKKTGEIKKERKVVLDEISVVLGDKSVDFLNAYNYFITSGKGKFQHFINTRDGSGIFARHGANNKFYQDEKGNQLPIISFEEIKHNIQVLIYEWINYKLIKSKGYRHPPIERASRIVDLKDEDFNFDL